MHRQYSKGRIIMKELCQAQNNKLDRIEKNTHCVTSNNSDH